MPTVCAGTGETSWHCVIRALEGALAAGLQDSSELGRGPVNVVVDDHCVESLAGDLLLGLGPGQSALDGVGIVGRPVLQPPALLVSRGRR